MTRYSSLEYVICSLCGGTKYAAIGAFRSRDVAEVNRSLQKAKKSPIGRSDCRFTVVQCASCSLSFINPRLRTSDLVKFYEGFYAKRFTGNEVSFEKTVYSVVNLEQEQGRLHEIQRFTKKGKLLDIGAGPGHFLKVAKDAGWRVFGQDLSHHAADIAKKEFDIDVFAGSLADLPYSDNFFDVVTLHSTIEHTQNPMEYIAVAYQKLKPGGLLVFNTPNIHSINFFLAKALSIPYPGFIFEHLYYFTPHVIRAMLAHKFALLEMTSYHHSRPLYPQTHTSINQKPKNKYIVFLEELRHTQHKSFYIRHRLYSFQMRLLREVLEYNRTVGKLQLGDVLYVFARKNS